MKLEDKVAIITGASSGIGEAAALLFAAEGAKLILGARRGAVLDDLVNRITLEGGTAIALAGDVREESYADRLVETAIDTYGSLNIGFNNAGTLGPALPIEDLSADDWHTTIDTNLSSAFYAAKYQVPAMKRAGGGSIIFTSSFVGHTAALPGMGAYAASKAGLIGLTQVLATELGASGIRANALLPGGTRTAMAGDLDQEPERLAFLNSLHALKRLAAPEEIAQVALFLASDQSSFVTGSALIADGGNSINKV